MGSRACTRPTMGLVGSLMLWLLFKGWYVMHTPTSACFAAGKARVFLLVNVRALGLLMLPISGPCPSWPGLGQVVVESHWSNDSAATNPAHPNPHLCRDARLSLRRGGAAAVDVVGRRLKEHLLQEEKALRRFCKVSLGCHGRAAAKARLPVAA